ncbi:cytochrome c oxidase subunit 3 family protein [bacterium]|nr:cytochrome c oxidase subunit 3 family protein [bacterium]
MSTNRLVNGVQVASHYRDEKHQYASNKEGIWLFMVTEILMFGGLFVGYILFHSLYPEMFAEGASFLDWKLGFVNTLVLIFSSLTMALGIYFNQVGQPSKATWALWTTVACGAIFMIIKYFEYTHKFHMGIFPGKFLDPVMMAEHGHTVQNANLGLYFGFYFCMSGLHGLHVLIGMGLISWIAIKNMKREFNPKYFTPIEGVGIFWHIVDLIWIFLFPLLYLVG